MIKIIYYYPNRPVLVPPDPETPLQPKPDYINSLEESGKYLAELKYNGDNIQIHTDTMKFWNRYKELHNYQPSEEVIEELSRWPKNSILNAELMHSRTVDIKHTIIIHCIMAWKGDYLIGKTWRDSRNILDECINQGLSGPQVKISPVWEAGFWKLFQETDGKILEGIILKNPEGRLVFSATPIKDVNWMLKIRKSCKKYPF